MEELIFAGNKYISSKRASKIAGYTTDYVGQMCRGEKLDCRLVGRNWYINEKDVIEHRKNFKKEQSIDLNNNSNKEELNYKKIDFEPMYYSYDDRNVKPSINKALQKAENIFKQEENDKVYNEDIAPIKIIKQNKPIKIYQDRSIIPVIKQNIIRRQTFALQKKNPSFSLAKVIISTVFLLFIVFTIGTIILEQKLSYISFNKDVLKTTLQVASVSTWFK